MKSLLTSYKFWIAVSAGLAVTNITYFLYAQKSQLHVDRDLWEEFSEIPIFYKPEDSVLQVKASSNSPNQVLSYFIDDYKDELSQFETRSIHEGLAFRSARPTFWIGGLEVSANCSVLSEPPTDDYLKIQFSMSYQKPVRFKVLDLNDLSYTECLTSSDDTFEFESYLDPNDADTIVFSASFRSLNANRNKFKLSMKLFDNEGNLLDRFPRKDEALEDVIKGTLRAYPILDTLFSNPKADYKELIAKKTP